MCQTFKTTLDILLLIVVVSITSTGSAFASMTETCAGATPLELDTTYRGANAHSEVFILDVPAAGIVAVDVTVPGTAPVEPKLGFLGSRCSTSADTNAATIERKAAHQTVAFRTAGEYYFRVAAQDPRQTLEAYKVHARFVAAEVVEDVFEMELEADRGRVPVRQSDFFVDSAAKVDEQRVDPDPNGLGTEPVLSLFAVDSSDPEKVDEQRVDPDPNGILDGSGPDKVDEQRVDPDPNGILGGSGPDKVDEQRVDPDPNGVLGDSDKVDEQRVDPDPNGIREDLGLETIVIVHEESGLELDGFCRHSDADDHGDLDACATVLSVGHTIAGQIANPWNDDVDVFAIEISNPQTLVITTRGEADTFGGLYDRFGQRLATDDDGSDGTNFRIVKNLDGGRYFLRVEGAEGAEGPFELTIASLEW